MPKKYLTVQLEIDFELDEVSGETQMTSKNIESIYPESAYLHDLTPEDVLAVRDYLRFDDDAYFDLGWELKQLLSKNIDKENQ